MEVVGGKLGIPEGRKLRMESSGYQEPGYQRLLSHFVGIYFLMDG